MQAFQDATCGAVGAMFALTTLYPLTVVKVKLQAARHRPGNQVAGESPAGHLKYVNSISCFRHILNTYGIFGLYVGVVGAVLKAGISNFIYFFFFSAFKKFFQRKGRKASILWSLLHGIVSGMCNQLFILPMDMIVARTQTTEPITKKASCGILSIATDIINKDGVLAFWSGIGPGMILTLNPGIVTVVRNLISSKIKIRTASTNFWIGLCSKLIASILTYPYIVLKTRMMTKHLEDKKPLKASSTVNTLHPNPKRLKNFKKIQNISRSEHHLVTGGELKRMGLFRGIAPQLVNSVLKEAIKNSVRIEISAFVRKCFSHFLQP